MLGKEACELWLVELDSVKTISTENLLKCYKLSMEVNLLRMLKVKAGLL